MTRVEDCIRNNRDVVYNLLGSHGDTKSLVHLATLLRDTDKVIQYKLATQQITEVLSLLASDPGLVYQYCPVLLQHDHQATITTLINMGRNLGTDKVPKEAPTGADVVPKEVADLQRFYPKKRIDVVAVPQMVLNRRNFGWDPEMLVAAESSKIFQAHMKPAFNVYRSYMTFKNKQN